MSIKVKSNNKSLSVAFDFDGVIHKDVGPTDSTGNRHPTIPFHHISSNPFNKVLDLMKLYIKNKWSVYILTARPSTYKNLIKKSLFNYGIELPKSNIICTGDTGGDKVQYLENYFINHFYDDSIAHFKKIRFAKNKNQLKLLKKLYLTKPESDSISEIII
jgi:hypothetical protein